MADPKQVIVANQEPIQVSDAFTGLTGFFRQWAAFGIIGVMSGLLVYDKTVQQPVQLSDFHQQLREERSQGREDAKESRKHGDDAVGKITEAMREQWRALGEHQRNVAKNQEQMIDLMRKQLNAMPPK